MRGVIWLVLLFVVAVVAATTLGRNDGLVSIYFGDWRTDLSLNLFVILVLLSFVVLLAAARSISGLVSLPRRAREWRQLRHERAAHAGLREALAEYFAARYSRAHRAAQRALVLQDETDALKGDADFREGIHHPGLGHQPRPGRAEDGAGDQERRHDGQVEPPEQERNRNAGAERNPRPTLPNSVTGRAASAFAAVESCRIFIFVPPADSNPSLA